jgi:hypothetical protein
VKALLKGATAEVVSTQAVAAAKTAVTLEVREREWKCVYMGEREEEGEGEMGRERVNA